jgi:hypothetical protein
MSDINAGKTPRKLSQAETDRLRTAAASPNGFNVTKARVPGWRNMTARGLVTLTKVPGVDIWVAQATYAGRLHLLGSSIPPRLPRP